MANKDDFFAPLDIEKKGDNGDLRITASQTTRKPWRGARFISALSVTLIVFGLALGAAFVYMNALVRAPGPLSQERLFVVERGQNLSEIAARLEDEHIIYSRFMFMAKAGLDNKHRKIRAGEFRIKAELSTLEVLNLLTEGAPVLYSLTIPEGLTSRQIVERIMASEVLTGQVTQIPPEGTLMPDTYKFIRGTDRAKLIARMRAAQTELLDTLWKNRAERLPLTSREDMLILASIVEKETAVPAERARIAGVFINRLLKGMRLQSDPTIIYGLVGGQGSLGRPIRKSEITKPTPYNTYVIKGLPPGPIGTPGRASLEAVARPAATDDLYFVADGTGGHAFATTLTQHQENVRKWRRLQRQRQRQDQHQNQHDIQALPIARDVRKSQTSQDSTGSVGVISSP